MIFKIVFSVPCVVSFPFSTSLFPQFFPTSFGLHGKSSDYKIAYTSVAWLFLLPHQSQVFFVASLNPPIRHGMTYYDFLVFLVRYESGGGWEAFALLFLFSSSSFLLFIHLWQFLCQLCHVTLQFLIVCGVLLMLVM